MKFSVTDFHLSFDCNRCQEEDLIVAMDSTTGRILHCEKTANKKRFPFSLVKNFHLFHLINFDFSNRLLPKKRFKEPARPKAEKLGAQHVKC